MGPVGGAECQRDAPGPGEEAIMSHGYVAVPCWFLAVSATALSAFGAGHYELAWWRQKGAWENGSGTGCLGNHVMSVWVFDESGNPRPNVQLKTTWNVLLGTTDADGRAEIPIDVNNQRYDMVCADGAGSTSDVALEMSSRLQPCWGHYSFEVGFLYKSASTNPGTFDTNLHCTLNTGCADYGTCPQTTDAPYTMSLAYNGINCADYFSDQAELGTWQSASSYFGQTFVATANRVVAARAHGTIGGNNTLAFNAQILTWPGLQPVGPVKTSPVRYPFGWVVFWGANEVPVVPGQTYLLKIWRSGDGMNAYRVAGNVYANGQYYEGATAFSNRDLVGFVCCMDYGSQPTIHITAGPQAADLQPDRVTIQWTTDVAGDSKVEYGPTAAYGSQAYNASPVTSHSVVVSGLAAGQLYHYRVVTAASGYNAAYSNDATFTTPTSATGTIAGTTKDGIGADLNEVIITTSPGGYGATSSGGVYTISNVPVGTYAVSAWKPGYCEATTAGVTVTAGGTANVNFALHDVANEATNPGFNSDLSGWTTFGNGVTWNAAWAWAIPSHTGAGYAGRIISWGGAGYSGGAYQTVTSLAIGQPYNVSTYIFTDSWEGGDRQNEYPNNVEARLGVDLSGGTNPASATVTWTPYAKSYNHWSPIKLAITPTASTATIFLQYRMTDTHEWNKAAFDDVYVSPVLCAPAIVILSGPVAGAITSSSATISWQTDVASDSRVDYGLTTAYGSSQADGSLVTSHSLPLTNLQANTLYHFKVTSAAPGYTAAASGDFAFTTLPLPPVAEFTADRTSGDAPLTVQFADQSTGAIESRTWNFGDGGQSAAVNPTHVYQAAGTYTVSLTVVGPGGSDTETKIDYITVSRATSADFDQDHDVDLSDFAFFQACFNGPNRSTALSECGNADFDGDADVDLSDFAFFQACFNGPNRPPPGGCE